MTIQARTTLRRDIRAALTQLQADIPPMQFWTVAAQRAAEEKFAGVIEEAAVTYAEALAQPVLFDASGDAA